MPEYGPREQYLDAEHPGGYSWWGVCQACGAQPHAPDPDDADFGVHRPGCPIGAYEADQTE